MRNNRFLSTSIFTLLCAALWRNPLAAAQVAVGTAFTYQGDLELLGNPVTDTCGFEFSLWSDELSTDPGDEVGSTIALAVGRTLKALQARQCAFPTFLALA